jgi:transcriptional regulator with XRE-family HTH domain
MTQTQFARIMGVSPQTISNWETGHTAPSKFNEVTLLSLKAALSNPEGKKQVFDALHRAHLMPSDPEKAKSGNWEDLIAAGLIGVGLVMLLKALSEEK